MHNTVMGRQAKVYKYTSHQIKPEQRCKVKKDMILQNRIIFVQSTKIQSGNFKREAVTWQTCFLLLADCASRFSEKDQRSMLVWSPNSQVSDAMCKYIHTEMTKNCPWEHQNHIHSLKRTSYCNTVLLLLMYFHGGLEYLILIGQWQWDATCMSANDILLWIIQAE